MKHNKKVTFLLILFFFISQIVGLLIINQYVHPTKITSNNGTNITVQYNDVKVLNEKIEWPEMNQNFSWITIISIIILSTIIILLIIRFKKIRIWKSWFGLSVFFATYIALLPFINKLLEGIGKLINFDLIKYNKFIIGTIVIFLVFLKLYKHNIFAHNFTEIIMYGGIATIFIPILNLFSASMLLIAISIYDFIAVWKIKHMVTMAKFQMNSNMFSGIMVAYDKKNNKILSKFPNVQNNKEIKKELEKELEELKKEEKEIEKIDLKKDIITSKKLTENKKHKKQNKNIKQAVLGGGDIAFPLIFAGTIYKLTASMLAASTIVLFSTIAVSLLFYKSKPDKFYPAMPFISAGCFVGYGIVFLVSLLM